MGGVHRDRSTESSGMEGLVDNSCHAILWNRCRCLSRRGVKVDSWQPPQPAQVEWQESSMPNPAARIC